MFDKHLTRRKFKCCPGKRLAQTADRLIVQLLDDIQKPDLIVLHQFVGSTANSNSSDDQLDDKVLKTGRR